MRGAARGRLESRVLRFARRGACARQPAVARPPAAERVLRYDTTAGVAWLDILHDTTLERLVAARRSRRIARCSRRWRASASIAPKRRARARSSIPNVAINGSESTNQIAFGSTVIGYRAARLTGDMSWELDFWGRLRRGLEAANADAASQDAAERAVLLSLVSDVATGYLQLLELDQERAIAERTLASRRATLDLARQRYARGVISELDVRQFEAQVAAPAVTLAQVERQTARHRAQSQRAARRGAGAASNVTARSRPR